MRSRESRASSAAGMSLYLINGLDIHVYANEGLFRRGTKPHLLCFAKASYNCAENAWKHLDNLSYSSND